MKFLKIFLTLGIILCLTLTAYAHPPSTIKIQFDLATQILKADIEHRVSDPATHYINKVDIGLNGEEIQTLSFPAQATPKRQILEIQLAGVKSGDTISVEGYCNLSGKLTEKITVV